jgi:hypothetical protein
LEGGYQQWRQLDWLLEQSSAGTVAQGRRCGQESAQQSRVIFVSRYHLSDRIGKIGVVIS